MNQNAKVLKNVYTNVSVTSCNSKTASVLSAAILGDRVTL